MLARRYSLTTAGASLPGVFPPGRCLLRMRPGHLERGKRPSAMEPLLMSGDLQTPTTDEPANRGWGATPGCAQGAPASTQSSGERWGRRAARRNRGGGGDKRSCRFAELAPRCTQTSAPSRRTTTRGGEAKFWAKSANSETCLMETGLPSTGFGPRLAKVGRESGELRVEPVPSDFVPQSDASSTPCNEVGPGIGRAGPCDERAESTHRLATGGGLVDVSPQFLHAPALGLSERSEFYLETQIGCVRLWAWVGEHMFCFK